MFRSSIAVLIVLFSPSLWSDDPSTIYPESSFLNSLDFRQPDILESENDLQTAKADALKARIPASPEVFYEAEDFDEAGLQETFALSWSLPIGKRRALTIRASESGVMSREYLREGTLFAHRLNARRSYIHWFIAERRTKVLRDYAQQLSYLSERIRQQFQKGERSGLEADRLERELQQLEVELQLADIDRENAFLNIRMLARGVPMNATPVCPMLPALSGDLDVMNRMDIRASIEKVKESRMRNEIAESIFSPPALTAGWLSLDSGEITDSGVLYGVSWTIPWPSGRKASRIRSESELHKTEEHQAYLVRKSKEELQLRMSLYRNLREKALQAGRENSVSHTFSERAMTAYRLGEMNLTDLLDIFRTSIAARLAQIARLNAALNALVDLEQTTGKQLEPGVNP